MKNESKPTTCRFCEKPITLKEDVWAIQSPNGTIPECDVCANCAKDTLSPTLKKRTYKMYVSRKAIKPNGKVRV